MSRDQSRRLARLERAAHANDEAAIQRAGEALEAFLERLHGPSARPRVIQMSIGTRPCDLRAAMAYGHPRGCFGTVAPPSTEEEIGAWAEFTGRHQEALCAGQFAEALAIAQEGIVLGRTAVEK